MYKYIYLYIFKSITNLFENCSNKLGYNIMSLHPATGLIFSSLSIFKKEIGTLSMVY